MLANRRLLIVGFSAAYHIGSHFLQAGQQGGLQVKICDPTPAYDTGWIIRQINWRLRNHRPPKLSEFSRQLVDLCRTYQPHYLLVTGILPPEVEALKAIRKLGVICLNYLTDDPWNPANQAGWFSETLPSYDAVFSPRRSNLVDLANLGCRSYYLPFAYNPAIHYPESPPPEKQKEYECDIMFYGGADRDRVPYVEALLNSGLNVHLYGGFWERYLVSSHSMRGMAYSHSLRWAVANARVTLCLVRRANRDGHVMRTYEAPAMGACMLTEDTGEHREIFGAEGEAVIYFSTVEEMVDKLINLLADDEKRLRLATAAHHLIVHQGNTYYDRLVSMLDLFSADP